MTKEAVVPRAAVFAEAAARDFDAAVCSVSVERPRTSP
jgi:hypothetical protein